MPQFTIFACPQADAAITPALLGVEALRTCEQVLRILSVHRAPADARVLGELLQVISLLNDRSTA